MRIRIIHQYYKTPDEGGALRSYYISQYFASLGYTVDVITATNEGKCLRAMHGSVEVHYLPVYYTNHLTFWSRVHAFYRFVTKSLLLLKTLPQADLNYVITTPLTTGVIALYAKRKYKTPYCFEVGDLWPEAPIQLGVIKNPFLKKLARYLEKKSYGGASKIVALSPDIAEVIKNRNTGKPLQVVTNMSDVDFFKPEVKSEHLKKKYKTTDKFVITYAGTVGMANRLEYLVAAARAMKDNNEVIFFVVGAGAQWAYMKSLASDLNNIRFFEFVDKQGVKEIMNVTDAVYISFDQVPVLATGSPNKFFDGIAAGKIILLNFKGWLKQCVEQNKCGTYIDPEKPEEFFSMIKMYVDNSDLLEKTQANARTLAETEFNKIIQLKRLQQFLSL